MKLFIEPSVSSLLARISHFLAQQNIQAYLTGGLVRDMLLGRSTADIDIAVAADGLEIAAGAAAALGGRYVLLDKENGVGRVVLSDGDARWDIDFSTVRGGIESDLARRDFTIDAIAIDLEKFVGRPQPPVIMDPFQGQDDIQRGIVRAVADSAFPSDPVRLLRAVRLAAELGFCIDERTEALIQKHSHLIVSVAGERVREELLKLLALPQTGQYFAYLDELGLLTGMIPELASAREFAQPREHFWDVLTHSIQMVNAAAFLLREGTWEYAGEKVLEAVPWSDVLKQHFAQEISQGSTRRSLLKLAALLHDIAKPQTRTINESGRTRFLGHAREGAAMAAAVLERLRFSAKEIKLVEVMVEHHLRPTQMSQEGLPSHRAIYRYFRDTGDAGIDILFLSLADHLATRGKHLDLAQWREHVQTVAYVLTRHFEEETLTAPPKLIDGHDLIRLFGLSPGPKIRAILEAVREAQAAGEVTTREEALTHVEHLLTSSRR